MKPYLVFYLDGTYTTFLASRDGDCLPRKALLRAIEADIIVKPGEYLIVESGPWSTDPPRIWRYTVASRTSLYINES